MNIDKTSGTINFEKELNGIDRFVLDFTSVLEKNDTPYVIVAGYVSIVFGRNRSSEDVDIFLKEISFDTFTVLWNALSRDFECLNATDSLLAYNGYLLTGHAIRFSKKGSFIPNMECKFPHTELDQWTLDHRKKIVVNGRTLFISPLELQIPFKLFLGTDKDIEDATYLYLMFKDDIDILLLREFSQKLKVDSLCKRYLS